MCFECNDNNLNRSLDRIASDLVAGKAIEPNQPAAGPRPCIECGQMTTGSVGAAGLKWPMLCQQCKDRADHALASHISHTVALWKSVLDDGSPSHLPEPEAVEQFDEMTGPMPEHPCPKCKRGDMRLEESDEADGEDGWFCDRCGHWHGLGTSAERRWAERETEMLDLHRERRERNRGL